MDRDLLRLAVDSLFYQTTCYPQKAADFDPLKSTLDYATSKSCVQHSAGFGRAFWLVDQATDATSIAGLVSPLLPQDLSEKGDIRKQSGLAVAARRINLNAPCDPLYKKKEVADGQKLFRNSRGDVERNTVRSPFGLSSIGQSLPPGSLPGRR